VHITQVDVVFMLTLYLVACAIVTDFGHQSGLDHISLALIDVSTVTCHWFY